MKIEFDLTVVGEKSAEFKTALNRDGEVINGSLEDLAGDAAGEDINALGFLTGEADLLRTKREENGLTGSGGRIFDLKLKAAFQAATGKAI